MARWTRRQVLITSLASLGGAALASISGSRFFATKKNKFPVRILGPSSNAGHRLRDGFQFPKARQTRKTDVLILGGGIAGLSAGWRLQKKGIKNFQILELESEVGGNSRFGENSISKFPWGAHYVTLLNKEADSARELFQDIGIVRSDIDKEPVYNEYFLCQAPHERLFIYQKWQEGLLPKIGVTTEEENQAKSFFAHVEKLRHAKGKDGKFAFSIPLDLSSHDPDFLKLDEISMTEYLRQNSWTSKPLNWYINYCCRDDYGTPCEQTSAWAGLHYFCSRRSHDENSETSSVITWPEGNGYIVQQLKNRLGSFILGDSMGILIERAADGIILDTWSEKSQSVTRWHSQSLIVAVPRFIADHLLPSDLRQDLPVTYVPWMVANISLAHSPTTDFGAPLAWDNVFYQGDSLGYVVATHQQTKIHTDTTVWSYYLPLDKQSPAEARRLALATSADQWRDLIVNDLSRAHPDIEDLITSIDVWIWGHAMVRPSPGFIWGSVRKKMNEPIKRIHFAHSDMSGISIFEEANYHGVKAADEVIEHDLS